MPTWVDRFRAFLRAEGIPEEEPVEERLRRLEDQLAKVEEQQDRAAMMVTTSTTQPTRTRYRLPSVESVPSRERREMSLRLPEEYKELIRKIAETEGRSTNSIMADILREGLERFLDRDPAEGARRLEDDQSEPSRGGFTGG
jgi:predicted DNA-binding protein